MYSFCTRCAYGKAVGYRCQHLALWRWCGGSPGEECDADSEAVRVILSITSITIHTQACMYSFCLFLQEQIKGIIITLH